MYRDKVEKTVCVSVWEGGWGEGWGEGGGWMPLPTRPQRYCDPASLVFFLSQIWIGLYRYGVCFLILSRNMICSNMICSN